MLSHNEILQLLKPFFQRVWAAIVTLFKHYPIRIGVSSCLLAAAVITGNFYIGRTMQYQDIISTTIRSGGESTPQRFKVLEAFIMSTIDMKLSERIEGA